jgi:hypothetical protein
MKKNHLLQNPILRLIIILISTTIVVWAPFWFNGKMDRVFANYDGPNYIVIAKCWYEKSCIGTNYSLPLPLEYYPAHFPGYPLIIKAVDIFLPGWWAMLTVTVISTIAMTTIFFLFLKHLKIKNPAWLATILLFLPARLLVLRSVGAPETLFVFAIIFSIFMFKKEKYLLSGLGLAMAQITKSPAILLFIAYAISIGAKNLPAVVKERKSRWNQIISVFKKYWPIALGPLAILPVFFFYQLKTADFWAYFNSGDNFHLFFPPFQSFVSSQSWLGDFWLEDIVYIYLIGGLAVLYLIKKYRWDIVSVFPTIFYLSTLLVAHRDISRYSVPLYPFWIIAFAAFLNKREFKIIFFILLPAIYLYATNFINYNVSPIADWAPYR